MSIAKQTLYERSQRSWTLYFIYFNLFNTNINKSDGFLTLSADIFPVSNGLLMILILQSTKSSRLMNFLWSLTSGRIGHIRISSLTTKNVMVRRFDLSAVGQSVTFLTTVPAPAVMPQSLFCTKTTVPKDNSSVRFVIQDSHQMKVASPL